MKQRFEHFVQHDVGSDNLEAEIKKFEADGWELCGVSQTMRYYYTLFFKRPIENE